MRAAVTTTPTRRALAALLFAVAAAGAAAADGPCRDDARKLCSKVQPGGGRAVACLKEHEADLSPACKAALPTMEQCAQELRTLCPGDDRRALRGCLRDKAAQLSPACRAMVPAR